MIVSAARWRRRLRTCGCQRDSTAHTLSPTSPAAKQLHLLHLSVATEAGETAAFLVDEIVKRASRAGAATRNGRSPVQPCDSERVARPLDSGTSMP